MNGTTCALLRGLLLSAVLLLKAQAADRWQQLLERNPFSPDQPAKPVAAPEPPPSLEFRGRSVENGVEYFSVYNLETKKAFWTSRAGGEEFRVQDYSPVGGLVLVNRSGKTVSLALKPSVQGRDGHRPRSIATMASTPVHSMVRVAPSTNLDETQRLEQVAERIRERRAQRAQRQQAGAKI